MKKKILHVLPSLFNGGVEWAVIDLVRTIKAHGIHESVVISSGGRLVKHLDDIAVKHIKVNFKAKNPWQILQNFFLIKKILQEEKIDIIHAHSRVPAWYLFLLNKFINLPFITTYHGAYSQPNFLKKIYNSVMTKGKFTIAISDFMNDFIKKSHPNTSNIALIKEGMNSNYFSSNVTDSKKSMTLRKKWLQDKQFLIMLPARFTRIKGHKTLLDALESIKQKTFFNQIKVIFVGAERNKYLDELKDFVDKNSLPVEFILDLEDIRIAYKACDLVICPSFRTEAFGRTVAEGMLMEKIVIGCNHGATPELVKSVVNIDQTINEKFIDHCLIEAGDHINLGKNIEYFFNIYENDQQTFKNFSQLNRQSIIRNFSLELMTIKTEEIYSKC